MVSSRQRYSSRLTVFKSIFILFSIFSVNTSSMVIDNLNDVRANWSAISDQVMGGISEVNFYEMEEDGQKFYRLEGNVSTENNGGFIQSRVGLNIKAKDFNGIRIKVRGNNNEYFVHLRAQECCRGTTIMLSFMHQVIGKLLIYHCLVLNTLEIKMII